MSRIEIPGIKTTSIKRVRTQDVGVYVWKLPNGLPLVDDEGNMLSITSRHGDIQKMAELSRTAKHYGFPDGSPQFVEGYKCDDEEYAAWIDSMLQGEY